nr:LysR family transcriptional regulator YbhD [Raoultella sp. NCTC 9187]
MGKPLPSVRISCWQTFELVLADIDKVSQDRVGLVTVATVPSAAYYFHA